MNTKAYAAITLITIGLGCSISAKAGQEKIDTLKAASISANKARVARTGERIVRPAEFLGITSAVGAGDVIKYIQTLPGISTGAEGSSAIYVRGGNIGSNVITLDGVPIYGSSHLLGFTSAYSQDIVSETLFQVGGFTSEEGNLTASHISVKSRDGDFRKTSASVSASNFLLGASVSTPIIKDRLSFLGSFRISPIGAELSAVKGMTEALDSVSGIKAAAYDAYGKLKWRINGKQSLSFSVFNSLDSYGYRYGIGSDERMRWSNTISTLGHEFSPDGSLYVRSSLSYNSFSNYQAMRKTLGEQDNSLGMRSSIDELTIQSTASGSTRRGTALQGGIKAKMASFNPGSSSAFEKTLMKPVASSSESDIVRTLLVTAHGQLEKGKENRYLVRASGRINMFRSWRNLDHSSDKTFFTPEASLLGRVNITDWMGAEATADWTTQHYHTLEGIPLGWSLDMTVPSDAILSPEKALQGYAGIFLSNGPHRLTVGGYYKTMYNLIFFADATQIFSSAAAGWRHGIKTGDGVSRGVELLYEYEAERLRGRLAYTLSKTDRTFEEVNNGITFPAKFDRRHILNVTAEYIIAKKDRSEIGLNTFFTYQSGHWATVPEGQYSGSLIHGGDDVTIDYFTTIHNRQMPAFIRWDIGVSLRYGIGTRHPGTLNVGVYNVLNRHNAYSVTYDTNERAWKQMSLFPIMPSLSWTMSF